MPPNAVVAYTSTTGPAVTSSDQVIPVTYDTSTSQLSGGSNNLNAVPITTGNGFYIDFSNPSLQGKSSLAAVTPSLAGGVGNTPLTISGSGDWNINGGFAKQNGTLAYAQFVAPNTLNELVIDFVPQATGSQFAMAMGVQPALAVQVIHLTATDTALNIFARFNSSLGLGNAEDGILGLTYQSALNTGGSTQYTIRLIQRGDTLVVVGPNGESASVTLPVIGFCAGPNAFFESAGTAWIKRFYGVCAPATSVYPAPYLSAADLPVAINPPQVQTYVGGGTGFQQISTFGNNVATTRAYLFFGPNGQYVLRANILASVTAGATSFQCDQPLPNGTYAFDLCSNSGSLKESITVSAFSGTSSPFTITCSAFANNHTLTAGIPFNLINTSTLTAAAVYGSNGNLFVSSTTILAALNNVIVGSDGFSNALRQRTTNVLGVGPDYGAGNPGTLIVTGAIGSGYALSGNLGGPTSSYTIPSTTSSISTVFLQPTATTTTTVTFPTPSSNYDGQELTLVNINNNTLTLTPAGGTTQGAPATLTQNQFAKFKWVNGSTTWFRIG